MGATVADVDDKVLRRPPAMAKGSSSKGSSRRSAPKPQVHYRSAVKGIYVSKRYAEAHPKTTVRETDKK
jgi:hypothetical protein